MTPAYSASRAVASRYVFEAAIANLIGVKLTGTLGILLKAKADGLVPQLARLVVRPTELGFRLSAHTREAVLTLAAEA